MKRSILCVAVLLAWLLLPAVAPGETAHNLLQQNNRTVAPYDLSAIPDILRSNANVFFVSSTATNASDQADGVHGETPDLPFATYDFAIGRCTANQNNVIVLLPYHTESFAAAGGCDVDVAGITTIGLGYGPARPKFLFTDTDGTFVVGRAGDGATFKNITFQASVSAVVVGVQHEDGADNITWIDCEWLEGEAAVDEFVTSYDVVTEANDLTFINCRATSADAAGATAFLDMGDGAVTRLTLRNCWIYGDYGTACLFSDQALTQVEIRNCILIDTNTDEYAFEFQGTANTGAATENVFVTSGNYVDTGGISLANNIYKTAGDSDTDGVTYSFADGAITAAKFGAAAIDATAVATDALGAAEIAANAIGAAEIANAAIDWATFAADFKNGIEDDIQATIDANSIVERVAVKEITTITNGNHDLFVVAGGPIKIVEIIGIVTTQIGAEGNLVNYNVDPTSPATDTVFGTDGTALETNGATVGSLLTWNGTVAADLVKTANGVALGVATDSGLIVPAGSIEMACANDGSVDGAIKVYMRYKALATGVTVTAAP